MDLGSCFPRSENPDLGHPVSWRTKRKKPNSLLESERLPGTVVFEG